MKDKINEICNKLNREQLSVYAATNEWFDLFDVSQQRELLVDFWMNLPNTNKNKNVAKHYIDKYLEYSEGTFYLLSYK